MSLTTDQKWLLTRQVSMLPFVIDNPDYGIPMLKSRQAGGSGLSQVDWFHWYGTDAKGIHGGRNHQDRHVTVTWTQLRKWAEHVPAELRTELIRLRQARNGLIGRFPAEDAIVTRAIWGSDTPGIEDQPGLFEVEA